MFLTLLLCGPALADRVYWTAPPDADARAAVARTLPGATEAPIEALVTGGAQTDGGAAIEALRRELAAARPQLDVFDGELQIMARLQKSTADVHFLRDDADRALLWEALVFQGLAVHRYFQDKLATESAAAPYRAGEGADARVLAWMDAAALILVPTPDATLLPDAPQRIAYDGVQAASRVMPAATIIVGDLAIGASVQVDGHDVEVRPGHRIGVVPGRHFVDVRVGDTVLLSIDARLQHGSDARIDAPFGPAELQVLQALVTAGREGWAVPPAALVPIQGAREPVYLAVPGEDPPRILRVDGGVAEPVRVRRAPRPDGGPALRVSAGGGWISTGDFLLQNGADGAPEARTTVNAGAPVVSVSGGWRRGSFEAGLGVDAALTLGEWHSLPTGEQETRTFVHPHAAVGLPWLQLTVGPLFPWYLGVGARAHVPVAGPLELTAAGLWGAGIARDRGADPAFEPQPLYAAWGGLSARFGR